MDNLVLHHRSERRFSYDRPDIAANQEADVSDDRLTAFHLLNLNGLFCQDGVSSFWRGPFPDSLAADRVVNTYGYTDGDRLDQPMRLLWIDDLSFTTPVWIRMACTLPS